MSDKIPPGQYQPRRKQQYLKALRLAAGTMILLSATSQFLTVSTMSWPWDRPLSKVPFHAAQTLQKCRQLYMKPGPPPDFSSRTVSDRYVEGTKPVFIKNATIWTGRVSGHEVVRGDIFLDKGLILEIGSVSPSLLASYSDLVEYEAQGAWVSPG